MFYAWLYECIVINFESKHLRSVNSLTIEIYEHGFRSNIKQIDKFYFS